MRFTCGVLALTWALAGCNSENEEEAVALSSGEPHPKLQSYFERYCDDDDSLGVGFVAWHTYDHRFRQQLKKTGDTELKRFFVLRNLYQATGYATHLFEEGVIEVGKGMRREMTPEERTAVLARISGLLDDLALFDPEDSEGDIAEFRKRLENTAPSRETE